MQKMKADAELLKRVGEGAIVSMPQGSKEAVPLLDELINKKKVLGVYLTTTQPHGKVIEQLDKDKIDHTSLFFLDLVGRESAPDENILILRDPSDLTELSVVITEVMENDGIKFLILDSVGGLETYVDTASVKKFLHALITYLKKLNKSLVILYSGGESKELMSFVLQVSDYHKD